MSSAPTAADVAAFLRDVTEATTKQQSTVESQTANGFAYWLADLPDRPGVRSPYVEQPDVAPALFLEVRPPRDPEPKPPSALSDEALAGLSDEEHSAYDDQWRVHRSELARWRAHKNLYDDLFAARTPAEDMELVLALGFVVTRGERDVLRRHLVTAAVEVELDRSSQALQVVLIDAARSELNWTDPVTRTALRDAEASLRDLQDASCLADASRAIDGIRASFGTRGVDLPGPRASLGDTQVGLSPLPALLLRKRDSSFLLQLLRDMADDMASGGYVSEPFQMIVSPTIELDPKEVLSDRAALPLPANEEQRVMIDNARRAAHLVIQGPPGTGKTHTIANLAAVLMAEGRRVLVTAENERALGEVQAKLPADMQPLMLPMLKERGTGPLQASVNELSSRASATSTAEARARRQAEALKRLEEIEAAITNAEERLSAIAREDRRLRTFGSVTMPVSGHLIALADRSAQLELVEQFLSPEGVLLAADARDLLELRSIVTSTHRDLATHRFPDGLMDPSDLARWLDEHRSQLAVLGDPSDFDYSGLADSVDALVRLATRLQELPPTAWSSITRTSEEYAEASEAAAGAAADLDHSVIVDPSHATADAIALCEEYLGLDGSRFDEPFAQLIARHRQAQTHAAGSAVTGTFERHDRADELTRECEGALELLRRDRSGLLVQHVQDHRTHGQSSIDTLVQEATGLVDGSRDVVGLLVTIEDGAPAFHELAAQAEQLRVHLASGGRMSGLVRPPKAVREADELVRFVKVGGSVVDTVSEAERARDHLRFRSQLAVIDSWAATHGLQRPGGIAYHDWLTAVVGVPEASEQVRAACKRADELVTFAFGTAPDEPAAFLAAALATVSKEVADALDGLVQVAATAPSIHLAGLPIRSRDDARRALGSIRASVLRASRHSVLPESWQNRCNPLDADDGDLLAEMLAVCAAAADVPGPARTANLTPSAVNMIAERAQRDRRRSELIDEHDRVIGRLHRTIVGCVPQSPATQAIAEAVRNEDPISYRMGMEALEREIHMVEQAHRFAAVRESAAHAHPQLLAALELEDHRAVEVLADIGDFERVRDHQRTVRAWLAEIGSAEAVHADLRRLHHEVRRAEQHLASLRCWDQAVERLQGRRELRSALSALTSAMDAVPKTRTAKSYPARMRALRKATAAAAPAIPCWVMTVDRVAEVLGYPTGEDRFDVVIVDEASQAWFPAMFLYAIADQVIVVGDKLQTSPSTAVVSVDQMATIAREHIFGHRLEDRIGDDLSLYDVAEVMTGPDMMVDHFRCVPEIIDISNRLSYAPMGRSLQPSRVRAPGSLEPVIHVPVRGARSGSNGANDAEVEAIVAEVVRCHADPRYFGMTFGVVVVGPNPVAQLKLLRTRLLDELGGEAMRERDLEVGTASQFQGAERHVMFLSLIVAPEIEERIRVWPHEHTGRNRRNVQQLNVAVSRARDQLWIFHSFHPTQLAPDDARAVLFGGGSVETASIEEQLEACDSNFERDVVVAIAAADETLVIRTQVEALGYSIDVVVEDQYGHRLAVECDGDRWHNTDSHIRSDLYRQRTLENIGWRFHRFLASEWYDDPARNVQAILAELVRSDAPASTRTKTHTRAGEPEMQVSTSGLGDDTESDVDPGVGNMPWDANELDFGDLDDDEAQELDPGGEPVDGSTFRLIGLLADSLLDSTEAPEDLHQPVATSDEPPERPISLSSPQPVPDPNDPVGNSVETLTCQSCGAEWTRRRVRGRKPTRCGSCISGRSATEAMPSEETPSSKQQKMERNRRLAAALRDAGKQPTGAVWLRAQALLDAGHSFAVAAREA